MIVCKECEIEVYIRQRNIGVDKDVRPYFCFCCESFLKTSEVTIK